MTEYIPIHRLHVRVSDIFEYMIFSFRLGKESLVKEILPPPVAKYCIYIPWDMLLAFFLIAL